MQPMQILRVVLGLFGRRSKTPRALSLRRHLPPRLRRRRTPALRAFVVSMKARQSLTPLIRNRRRDRRLGQFSPSVPASSSAFGNVGDRQPNLQRRVTITRILIADTDGARTQLDEFAATQARAAAEAGT